MVTFSRIRAPVGMSVGRALRIYERAFPANERQTVGTIAKRMMEGRSHLYLGKDGGGEVVFMALLFPLRGVDMVLLDYMATDERYRGKGIGSSFLSAVPGLIGTGKHLLLEVQHPGFGQDIAVRARRVAFYGRHGAKPLKGVRYITPTLSGTVSTEMVLMVMPGPQSGIMDGALVKRIIAQVYREVYLRGGDDPILRSFIDSVPDTVETI